MNSDLEQEVLGRVAGDRLLGEGDELGAQGLGAGDGGADAGEVAVEVADGRVDLGEGDPKGAHRGHPSSCAPTIVDALGGEGLRQRRSIRAHRIR